MAGKRPWCAEGVCTPSVPMHVKDCSRRKMYVDSLRSEFANTQDQKPRPLLQEIEDPDEREAERWVRGRAKCAAVECCGASKYHHPGCLRRASTLAKLREGEKPVLTSYQGQPKKPWWKRVFSRG